MEQGNWSNSFSDLALKVFTKLILYQRHMKEVLYMCVKNDAFPLSCFMMKPIL